MLLCYFFNNVAIMEKLFKLYCDSLVKSQCIFFYQHTSGESLYIYKKWEKDRPLFSFLDTSKCIKTTGILVDMVENQSVYLCSSQDIRH